MLVVLYYTLPLDRRAHLHLVLALVVGVGALVATVVWQARAVVRAARPAVRATQALATVIPLFLLMFASTYYVLAYQDVTAFGGPLTRTDALYFTVTVFATVGFGDVVPRTEVARVLVTAQMLLNLVVLGLGVRVIVGAVHRGEDRQEPQRGT